MNTPKSGLMKVMKIKNNYTQLTKFVSGGFLLLLVSLSACYKFYDRIGHSGDPGTVIHVDPLVQKTLYNHHATKESTINSGNVKGMSLNWKYITEAPVSHGPILDETGLYFGDWGGTIYKVDANTGALIWKNKVEEPMTMWAWHGFAGIGTLGGGKLFEASVEGKAFALNPSTGGVLWETDFADDKQAGNLGEVMYHNGLVYIGLQSVEEALTVKNKDYKPHFQGKVMALDANTGKKIWERNLVEAPQNGVSMWTSFALDPELNMLYFTTGNNYTGTASAMSDAMVAVDARTGVIRWYNQVTSHDVWTPADPIGPDYDFGGGAQLFVAKVNGKDRKLVGGAQKSGLFYAFDAITGKKVWSTLVGYGGVDGGMHGEASIGEGTIFAWSNNGYNHTQDPSQHPISVKALDAATGNQLWVKDQAQPAAIIPGYLANDVYFVGSLDGTVKAYNADNGEQLLSLKNPSPIISYLRVAGNSLYFGVGIPGILKAGQGENAMYAYSVK